MGDPKQRNLPKIDFTKFMAKKMSPESDTLDSESKQDQLKRLHDFLFKVEQQGD